MGPVKDGGVIVGSSESRMLGAMITPITRVGMKVTYPVEVEGRRSGRFNNDKGSKN